MRWGEDLVVVQLVGPKSKAAGTYKASNVLKPRTAPSTSFTRLTIVMTSLYCSWLANSVTDLITSKLRCALAIPMTP